MEWNDVLKIAEYVNVYIEGAAGDLIGCIDDNHPLFTYAYPVLTVSMLMQWLIDNAHDEESKQMAEYGTHAARRITLDFDERYKEYKRKATE